MHYLIKFEKGVIDITSRERVISALEFKEFDKVPLDGVYRQEVNSDVETPPYRYGKGRSEGIPYNKGSHKDFWGCLWEAGEDGVKGEVKKPLLTDWSQLSSFQPPWDALNEADLSEVNRMCQKSDKFIMKQWGTDPFQRMQYLRGTENLFMDLAYGDSEVYKLREMVHEFHLREVEMWAKTDVDGIHIEDDWGTQLSLLISPKLWREYFKPLYKDYCDIAHCHGKYVVMHSDGNISEIIPDLIEIGVNAVNAQLNCMDVEKLAELYHEKIAFWGGIDRQYLLPYGTETEVRAEVRRIASAFFKYKRTGIIGDCTKDKGHKYENILAVYDEWSKL